MTRRGVAAGVPYVAVPPTDGQRDAPLVVAWHLMEPPRSEAAMAAALPLATLPAWKVYFGLPFTGARLPPGGVEETMRWATEDAVLGFFGPLFEQGAEEFPAALAELREQLPKVADAPVTLVGSSAGGGVAQLVLTEASVPINAVVLINAAITLDAVVVENQRIFDTTYQWSDASRKQADRAHFVHRADEIAARSPQPPVLIVSGSDDYASFRADAVALRAALAARYADPDDVELVDVPGLAHPFADAPGIEPAPQNAQGRAVDEIVSRWLAARLPAG